MNEIYYLNNYDSEYDDGAIIINKKINNNEYIKYTILNQKTGVNIFIGKVYPNPTGDIKVDITELCVTSVKPIELDKLSENEILINSELLGKFKVDIQTINSNTDDIINTETNYFTVVGSIGGNNLNNSNYINQYYIDSYYNSSDSSKLLKYEVYKVNTLIDQDEEGNVIITTEDELLSTSNTMSISNGQISIFKFKMLNEHIKIKRSISDIVDVIELKLKDNKVNGFIYYLNDKGVYNCLPILLDHSIKKRAFSEKTYNNNRIKYKYNTTFRDSIDFKTPYLNDSEYSKVVDLIGSNYVYLYDKDNKLTKVNVKLSDFEYKTYKNTKSFNQFNGTIESLYTNNRYL